MRKKKTKATCLTCGVSFTNLDMANDDAAAPEATSAPSFDPPAAAADAPDDADNNDNACDAVRLLWQHTRLHVPYLTLDDFMHDMERWYSFEEYLTETEDSEGDSETSDDSDGEEVFEVIASGHR